MSIKGDDPAVSIWIKVVMQQRQASGVAMLDETHPWSAASDRRCPWVRPRDHSELPNSRTLPDFRALTGDPSDNIPGVRGIGPKTAADLLTGGLHLEQLRDSPRLNRVRCRAITGAWDQILTWRDMIQLNQQVPLPRNLSTGTPTPAMPRAAALLEELHLW